jgi:GNAT superfamily N-acetyltransferase
MQDIHVTFRLITVEDAEQLQANCMPRATVDEIRQRIPDHLRAHEVGEQVPLVAVVDGEVCGTATLVRHPHHLRRHIADIKGVVVDHRYWRRGIARRLFAELSARAAAMGIELLATSCRGGTVAETVYRRLGFTEYGRLPRGLKEASGKVFDEVFLYRPLPPAAGSDSEATR